MAGYPLGNGFNVTVQQHLDRERFSMPTYAYLDPLIPRVLPGHVCWVESEELHYKLMNDLTWEPLTGTTGGAQANGQTFPFANQALVSIEHNLGRLALVQVFLASGEQVEGQVKQVSLNALEIEFSQPLTGRVLVF